MRLAGRIALLAVVAAGVLWAIGDVRRRPPHREPFDGPAFVRGERAAPDLSAIPDSSPHAPGYAVQAAFPELSFDSPVAAVQTPRDGDDRLYVLEQSGRLWAVAADGAAKDLVLDLSERVHVQHEAGALGIAFHPTAGVPGEASSVFLFYVTPRDGALYDRVSRFAFVDGRVDEGSEQILIEQLHEWHQSGDFAEHFGGGLAFGPDGFLYVGFGDEGWVPERVNPQTVRRDFFAGLLRLDVDCRPGASHPPPRAPESGRTSGYCIPDDNPFVGRKGVLEEFWAIGLRNPWRFSFDRETGEVWIGDVGSDIAEEVNLGVPGGNYQWAYREGGEPYRFGETRGKRPRPFLGEEQAPLFTYPHGGGNGCVIAGYVYRGDALPALRGRYVFGDMNSGKVWALERREDGGLPAVEPLAQARPWSLLSFAELRSGEILLVGREHGLGRLVPAPRTRRVELPRLLSRTGLFADLETLTPAAGVVPYDVNVSFWSDRAHKRRWVAVPGDGSRTGQDFLADRVLYRRTGPWAFPPGTVFVKHFDLPIDETDPEATRRLETRLLVLSRNGGVYGATYRWDEDGRDASLLTDRVEEPIEIVRHDGSAGEQTWTYPSGDDCLVCHNPAAGYVLGVQARQLGRDVLYPGVDEPVPQIQAWERARMFTGTKLALRPVGLQAIEASPRLTPIEDEDAPLEPRARSYLDANCGYCHGGTGSTFDVRLGTPRGPLERATVRDPHGVPGGRLLVPGDPERSLLWVRVASPAAAVRMPPLGRAVVDERGAALLAEWIAGMKPS